MRKIRDRPKFRHCLKCNYYKKAAKYYKLVPKKKKKGGYFFKALVGAVVFHGTACVSMSYALAWTEHTQVVEVVSSTIITEIVAPIIIYGFTKTVENIFQKNELVFSKPIGLEKNGISAGAEESEGLG